MRYTNSTFQTQGILQLLAKLRGEANWKDQLLAQLGEEGVQKVRLGDYAGDDDCGLKEEDVVIIDLADAGVEFLVHGHQVLLVCNTWNGETEM